MVCALAATKYGFEDKFVQLVRVLREKHALDKSSTGFYSSVLSWCYASWQSRQGGGGVDFRAR